ncbi:MAG: hypothetical protein ABEK59_04140 [Halobacteria archaeon]
MDRKNLGNLGVYLAVLSPAVPWIYASYGGKYVTVFFSLGFLDIFPGNRAGMPSSGHRFVDIYSYTFELTQGFSGFYWFWHISVILVAAALISVYIGKKRMAGLLFVIASLSVLRLWMGLGRHPNSFVFPVGSPWLFVTGLTLFYQDRLS